MICHAYLEFIRLYGMDSFDTFDRPEQVNLLLFAQLCVYHYTDAKKTTTDPTRNSDNNLNKTDADVSKVIVESDSNNPIMATAAKKNPQKSNDCLDGLIGQVMVGDRKKVIGIPANSALKVQARTSSVKTYSNCLIDQAVHANLPLGVIVN